MARDELRFVVTSAGMRLDRLIADAGGVGRRRVRDWFEQNRVRIDGRVAAASDTPAVGSEIVVAAERDPRASREPALPAVPILVENALHVVVAKPAGLHCERGKSDGSVADFLESRYGDTATIGERPEEAGLVHRIDRDTSGVLVAARSADEYRRLREEFASGRTRKWYLALAAGRLAAPLLIGAPLARRGPRMAVAGRHDEALAAETRVAPLDGGPDWTLVLATMRTGVMHQVRVHLAARGLPLFGDLLYGGPALDASARSGQLLHALRVQAGGDLDVSAPAPADFVAAYASLRRRSFTSSSSPREEA